MVFMKFWVGMMGCRNSGYDGWVGVVGPSGEVLGVAETYIGNRDCDETLLKNEVPR